MQTSAQSSAPPKDADKQEFVDVADRVFCGSDQPVLHHVCLFVRDMAVSTVFYTSGLGLTLRESFDDIIGLLPSRAFPFKLASVFLQAGEGRYIELHPAGDGELAPPGFPLNHLALAVSDVDAAYEQALATGGSAFGFAMEEGDWDGAPLDVIMSGGRSEPMRMAFLQGPCGELVELYQASGANNSLPQTQTLENANAR